VLELRALLNDNIFWSFLVFLVFYILLRTVLNDADNQHHHLLVFFGLLHPTTYFIATTSFWLLPAVPLPLPPSPAFALSPATL
jgi:hypothetical protein